LKGPWGVWGRGRIYQSSEGNREAAHKRKVEKE